MTGFDIVVPSCGRPQALPAMLQALHDTSGMPLPDAVLRGELSITVSDDRFDPALGAALHARWPHVRYVAGPARGPASNRNHGAAFGRQPWLLFLDDDCLPVCDLLAQYRHAIAAQPGIGVFEGAVHAAGPRPDPQHVAPLNTTGGHLWSCNFAVRRDTFAALGGFDERFPYALEDCDFAQRLRAAGHAFVFVPAAVVQHPWRRTAPHEVWRHVIGHALMADKHPRFADGWNLLHLARAVRGRLRQYAGPRWWAIAPQHWAAVACDLVSPLVVTAAVRWPALRRGLVQRHANVPQGKLR